MCVTHTIRGFGRARRAVSQNTDRAVLALASPRAWESWLAKHHATSGGVWLKIVKKTSQLKGPSYEEALDAALCFGWIDGQKDSFDDDYWLQRFTPRKPRSRWSKINVERADRLTKEGRMKSAGLTEIRMAKADGRWDAAYESQRAASVPDDLRRALAKNHKARTFFESLDSRNRYAILFRIHDAKKPETRARRIETYIAMLSEGKKIHE
jgi:uncharacterized protein YdeI (YjbR/CyaY-like superfamily)